MRPYTGGESFSEWIESVGNSYYLNFNKGMEFVELRNYFNARRIVKVEIDADQVFGARIKPVESGFVIFLKEAHKEDLQNNRFLIAHEMAHTFLYNLNPSPPKDLNVFPAGSNEVEFVCNKLARSILIPESLLLIDIKKLNIHSPGFDFRNLYSLNKRLKVSNHVLLNRIILDLGLMNCLYVRFKKSDEINPWKLEDMYLPYEKWNNKAAFIPNPPKGENLNNQSKKPSAKYKLEEFLNSINSTGDSGQTKRHTLEVSVFKKTLLEKFMHFYYPKAERIIVIYNSFINEEMVLINVVIPLPD